MARPQTASITLAAASTTAVCASQTPGAAGALTLNGGSVTGGKAVLDVARRVLVTCAGNETGKTFTVTGTDRAGIPIQEKLAGPNATTVATLQDFAAVTGVAISAAAAGAVTVGTNGTGSTRWIPLDPHVIAWACSAVVNLGGVTATVSVEVTADPYDRAAVEAAPGGCGDLSVQGLASATFVPPIATAVTGLSGVSADTSGAISAPARAVRLTVTAGAASAGVRLTVTQAGL